MRALALLLLVCPVAALAEDEAPPASWSKLKTADSTVNGHVLSAAAHLAPRLELRLAF